MDEIHVNKPVDTVPYGNTVIPQNRLEFLASKCKETLTRLPGNVVEVGVYRGGTLIELAKVVRDVCPDKKVYGIDTFEGHPYTDGHPVHPQGKYSDVSQNELSYTLEELGLAKYVSLHKGKIEEIWDDLNIKNISFAHIDCDLYIPIKYSSEHIPSTINKGGVIYFDDYGHSHCPGATKAIEEVFEKKQIQKVSLEDGTCWSGYVEL